MMEKVFYAFSWLKSVQGGTNAFIRSVNLLQEIHVTTENTLQRREGKCGPR